MQAEAYPFDIYTILLIPRDAAAPLYLLESLETMPEIRIIRVKTEPGRLMITMNCWLSEGAKLAKLINDRIDPLV